MENGSVVIGGGTLNDSQPTAAIVVAVNDSVFYPLVKQPVHMIVIYTVAYSLVFLLGLGGNGLIVWVVYRNRRMHSVTNYFIVNLAVADILVCLFCLPITLLSNLFSGWRFGAVMCKVTPFLQGIAVSASVITLSAIALDRYLAICYTLEFRLTRKVARIVIVCIWGAAAGIMTPWAVYYHQRDVSTAVQTIYVCVQSWPSADAERIYFLCVIFLTCYSLPLVLVSACYAFIGCRVWNRNAPGVANMSRVVLESKMKVLRMLVAVVVVFAFSWLPLYALHLWLYFGDGLDAASDQTAAILTQTVMPVAQWLGSFNSCVNPIIYCFFSKKFRRGYAELVDCCSGELVRRHAGPGGGWTANGPKFYSSINGGPSGHTMYTYVSQPARAKQRNNRQGATII